MHVINHHARAQKGGVITATIKSRRGASRSSDQDPTDAILSVFLNAYLRFNRDRPSRSDGHDLIDRFDCLDGYDRFDRTVTIKSPIYRLVLRHSKASE